MFFKLLIFSAALETGFLGGGMFNYQTRNQDWFDVGALYTDLEAQVKIAPFYVGGAVITYFTPVTITNYSPFQMTYIFNAGIKSEGFQLGFEHSCFHPMNPYATIIGDEIKPLYEGGYNKFFVRFETGG